MLSAQQIKQARDSVKESQAAFAQRFGVDQATISRWETDGPPERGAARLTIERVISEIEQRAGVA